MRKISKNLTQMQALLNEDERALVEALAQYEGEYPTTFIRKSILKYFNRPLDIEDWQRLNEEYLSDKVSHKLSGFVQINNVGKYEIELSDNAVQECSKLNKNFLCVMLSWVAKKLSQFDNPLIYGETYPELPQESWFYKFANRKIIARVEQDNKRIIILGFLVEPTHEPEDVIRNYNKRKIQDQLGDE